MKAIAESAEVFEAYAMIDYAYYMLKECQKKYFKPVAPIVQMADASCGYDRTKEEAKTVIDFLELIIENKKIVEADYSGDENILNQIKQQLIQTT